MRCANGHKMADADTFCGSCGAPSEPDLFPADPEWADAQGSAQEEAHRCPIGHPNPTDNRFCGICGAAIIVSGRSPGPPGTMHAVQEASPPRPQSTARAWWDWRWTPLLLGLPLLAAGFMLYRAGTHAGQQEWTFEYTSDTSGTFTIGCGPANEDGGPQVLEVPVGLPSGYFPTDEDGYDDPAVYDRCTSILDEDRALQNRYWIWAAILGVLALPLVAIGLSRIWQSPPGGHHRSA